MTDDCWVASVLSPWYPARVCGSWRRHPPLPSSAGLSPSCHPSPSPLLPQPCSLPAAFLSAGGLQLPAARAGLHQVCTLRAPCALRVAAVSCVLCTWCVPGATVVVTAGPIPQLHPFFPCSCALSRPALVSRLTTGSRFIEPTLPLVTWQFNLEHQKYKHGGQEHHSALK